MIVLIPTNDGINLAPGLNNANAFRCLNLSNATVKEDLIREIKNISLEDFICSLEKDRRFTESQTGGLKTYTGEKTETGQYGVVITSAISGADKEQFQKHNFEIILSKESNIINALLDYIKHFAPSESDYCCCP